MRQMVVYFKQVNRGRNIHRKEKNRERSANILITLLLVSQIMPLHPYLSNNGKRYQLHGTGLEIQGFSSRKEERTLSQALETEPLQGTAMLLLLKIGH